MKQASSSSARLDSPVLAFISLERCNAVRLVQTVHSSLAGLNKVLRGSSLLTTDVQKLAGPLLKHEVFLQSYNVNNYAHCDMLFRSPSAGAAVLAE